MTDILKKIIRKAKVKTVKKIAELPTETKPLSSVNVATDAELGKCNVYGNLGVNKDDRQFEFFKSIRLVGQTKVGLLDCWTNTKQWTLTTEYKKATGLPVNLYHGLKIRVLWDLLEDYTDSLVFNTDTDPTLNVDGYGAKPIRKKAYQTGTILSNEVIAMLDFNFICYMNYTTFEWDSNINAWLIQHDKQGESGLIVYKPNYVTNGYFPCDLHGGFNPVTNPLLHSIYGDTPPAMQNASMVGYNSDGTSPFITTKQGQVEYRGQGSNGGFLSIKNGFLYKDSNAYGGGVTITNQEVMEDTYTSGYEIEPIQRTQINIGNYLNDIKTGTETLTRRLGLYSYIVA